MSLLYGAVVAARRALAVRERLPVPVVVVGNITVGGTGKTPLVLWLAAFLRARGLQPGIVARGYGGTAAGPAPVAADSDPGHCGDEPVLLAQRSGCPVWIGADRVAAGRALLAAHPACDVILSDDGLQHHRLARDVEICVVDAALGFGNDWLLPAGPLREPRARLAVVDAVALNVGDDASLARAVNGLPKNVPCFSMALEERGFRNLLDPSRRADASAFRGQRAHAVAGIGHPQRFFRQLERMGLAISPRPFPDHHRFSASDLDHAGADAVLMTEKDAVKCSRFARDTHWALIVDAVTDSALGELVLRRLQSARK